MIVCLAKGKAIVITRDFQSYYIKRSPTYYVGRKIEFTETDIIKNRPLSFKMGLTTACIVILFAVLFYLLLRLIS
ncbi:anti-sigma factor domain-containing protein [Pseudobacteroides sp.]|uniref:anti-sigma factor domain-containing protein n=1 Tax=Pseudobacteroides sp. TaxID=1968840 RepID=UPI0039C9AEF5